MKYSAIICRNHLTYIIGNELGFKYSLAYPKVWYKSDTDETGFKYYTYILFYVYTILILYNTLKKYMDILE